MSNGKNQNNKNNNNNLVETILNDSFQIPKERIIYFQEEKEKKLNIISTSLSNLPTCTTSNSNINNTYIRKRPFNIIHMSNKKVKKKKYKQVTFEENLVEYINVCSYKNLNYLSIKNSRLYKKEVHPEYCNCFIY
jgi:hypothetical protein